MPQGHATSRPRRTAWRLPTALLSGLFMIVTVGLPSLASTAQSRELSIEAKHEAASGVAIEAVDQSPDVVAAAPFGTELGLAPPPPARAVVDPLAGHGIRVRGNAADADLPRESGDSAHPDRAPPVTGQQ
ncbi:hypothetical protein [Phytoactinopolyspora endophytica]|uniref:hypothetical protein n=1 Tax=Phytoactinopolyspora endophytica TaxID=1642495 RepID=UPI00101C9C7D|nr:hypothetical protein [Phytoactinopolyspora endophytica]